MRDSCKPGSELFAIVNSRLNSGSADCKNNLLMVNLFDFFFVQLFDEKFLARSQLEAAARFRDFVIYDAFGEAFRCGFGIH